LGIDQKDIEIDKKSAHSKLNLKIDSMHKNEDDIEEEKSQDGNKLL